VGDCRSDQRSFAPERLAGEEVEPPLHRECVLLTYYSEQEISLLSYRRGGREI